MRSSAFSLEPLTERGDQLLVHLSGDSGEIAVAEAQRLRLAGTNAVGVEQIADHVIYSFDVPIDPQRKLSGLVPAP
jgi:hypothetical protein